MSRRDGPASSEGGSLEAARLAALAELRRTPRARPWWVEALVLVGVNLAFGLGATVMLKWNDVQHASLTTRYGMAALLVGLLIMGAVSALHPAGDGLRFGLTFLALLGVAGVALGGSGNDPGASLAVEVRCALFEGVLGSIPTLVTLLVLSRFAASPSRTIVGAAAASAGAVLALHLHCPIGTPSHLVVFHVLPWVLVVLGALAIRGRLRSWSFAP